ncbi:MAG: AmmeMemoRadiSam system protein B [Bryobacteraceae bacterium]|nr:AmmeMemoRadiSam system protein B [Bryobacteraceae bacterium]
MPLRSRALPVLLPALLALCSAEKPRTRPPAVAGAFYPADPEELARTVDELLAKAAPQAGHDAPVALVVPHAGYMYSGGVAAHAYALLKGRKYERVVVISPSHVDAFGFAAIYDGDAYSTPLGTVPVDKAFAARLARSGAGLQLSDRGHQTRGERGEHALEVQLPFLQRALGEFRLVPIVMGDQRYEACRAVGVALGKAIEGGGETLIIASSDLSHFHRYEDAVRLDRRVLKAIGVWDYSTMARNFELNVWEACGGGPIVAAMIAAERLGARQVRLLKYANSGDVTGDRSQVVGYAAVAFFRPAKTASDGDGAAHAGPWLRPEEQRELLWLARKSVETAVRERRLYEGPAPRWPALLEDRGAFVTLKRHGQLRGCIGYVFPVKPLYLTVRDVAAMAAVRDERFPPVTTKELDELEYEVSVLSPLRRVLSVEEIVVGRHGLVVKRGDREGLLLPQVASEQRWDRRTFLEQTCLKAGLPPGAWRDPETDIFRFTAFVFDERQTVSAAPQTSRPAPRPASSRAPASRPF